MSLKANSSAFVPGQFSLFRAGQPTFSIPPVQPATTVQPSISVQPSIPAQPTAPAQPVLSTLTTPSPEPTVKPQQVQPKPAPAVVQAPLPTQTTTTEDDWEKVKVSEANEEVDDEDGDDEEDVESKKEKKKRLLAEADAELVAKDDPREHINIVFIGHVDAGKSTLSGQILLSTGMVDQRTIEKLMAEAKDQNRSSWFLAYMLDINQEERTKGITVEVGRAHFSTPSKRYTILDAPGHKNYVPNMITGVAQADVGILVISARKGEFEAGFDRSGQTREHALLAKTLGVKKLIVAINKMDEPTVEWSKERYDSIQSKLGAYLKSIGYNVKEDVIWIPLSGYTGANVKEATPEIPAWYTGGPLLTVLDELKPLERLDERELRVPVLDKYKESGKLHIMGKVETGVLKTGDTILSNPGSILFKVLQIQNDENVITVAKPGENVKILVKGTEVEEDGVLRGSVISHPSSSAVVTQDIVCQLAILQLLETKPVFTAGYSCVIHIHTGVEEISCVRLLDQLDPKTGQSLQKLPKFVKEKAVVIAHFTLVKPICAERFEDFQQLGRFSLRDEGKTIGFGKILSLQAPVKRRK